MLTCLNTKNKDKSISVGMAAMSVVMAIIATREILCQARIFS